jgi:hypothetical protein
LLDCTPQKTPKKVPNFVSGGGKKVPRFFPRRKQTFLIAAAGTLISARVLVGEGYFVDGGF